MKVEPRGKFGGVKIHLEPEECKDLLDSLGGLNDPGDVKKIDFNIKDSGEKSFTLMNYGLKMGHMIKKLQKKEPGLLDERTPEQVKAILAKEVEKAKLQLAQVEAGKSHEKVDPAVLKKALLKYVGE